MTYSALDWRESLRRAATGLSRRGQRDLVLSNAEAISELPDLRNATDEEVIAAIKSVPCHFAGQKFDQTMRTAGVRIATGNTAIDGSGSLTSIVTGAATGTRIRSIWVQPIATITDGHVAFFLYDGSNNRFLGTVPFNAYTVNLPSKPPIGRPFPIPNGEILLPSASYILKACPYNSESFDIIPNGADL